MILSHTWGSNAKRSKRLLDQVESTPGKLCSSAQTDLQTGQHSLLTLTDRSVEEGSQRIPQTIPDLREKESGVLQKRGVSVKDESFEKDESSDKDECKTGEEEGVEGEDHSNEGRGDSGMRVTAQDVTSILKKDDDASSWKSGRIRRSDMTLSWNGLSTKAAAGATDFSLRSTVSPQGSKKTSLPVAEARNFVVMKQRGADQSAVSCEDGCIKDAIEHSHRVLSESAAVDCATQDNWGGEVGIRCDAGTTEVLSDSHLAHRINQTRTNATFPVLKTNTHIFAPVAEVLSRPEVVTQSGSKENGMGDHGVIEYALADEVHRIGKIVVEMQNRLDALPGLDSKVCATDFIRLHDLEDSVSKVQRGDVQL